MTEKLRIEREDAPEMTVMEVSGWDQNGQHFTERVPGAMNFADGNKSHATLKLRQPLAKKATLFVRCFLTPSSSGVLHNPYCVVDAKPVAQEGGWEYKVTRLRPQKKAPNGNELASNLSEETERSPEPRHSSEGSGTEEVLHEA